MTNQSTPPEWANNAFILATRYLAAHLEQNTNVQAAEAFNGASVELGGKMIMMAYEGNIPSDAIPKPEEAKRINPLAIILLLAGGTKARVKDIAEKFGGTADEIKELIEEEGSGLKIGAAGWVQLTAGE